MNSFYEMFVDCIVNTKKCKRLIKLAYTDADFTGLYDLIIHYTQTDMLRISDYEELYAAAAKRHKRVRVFNKNCGNNPSFVLFCKKNSLFERFVDCIVNKEQCEPLVGFLCTSTDFADFYDLLGHFMKIDMLSINDYTELSKAVDRRQTELNEYDDFLKRKAFDEECRTCINQYLSTKAQILSDPQAFEDNTGYDSPEYLAGITRMFNTRISFLIGRADKNMLFSLLLQFEVPGVCESLSDETKTVFNEETARLWTGGRT